MAANVTVRGKFLDDARPDLLGQLLGIDPEIVRMRLIRLWSWMTDQHKGDPSGCEVDEIELMARFGPDGPAHLVRCKLAREVGPGRYYVCGANGDDEGKSDLAWLARKRSAGGKGGEKSAQKRSEQAQGKQTPSTEQAEPKHEASTDEARSNPQDPGSGIRDSGKSEETQTPGLAGLFGSEPPPTKKPDRVADLWAEQERLRAETIPGSRPLKLTRDRRKLIQARLDDGYSVDDLKASLEFRAAQARLGDSEWFNGDANWSAKSVAYALGKQGTQARAGPVGTGSHPPVSRALTLDDAR